MPLHEYRCLKCGDTFEVIQKFSDSPLQTCAKCGGTLDKLLSSPAIHFKGAGWYITDYSRKSGAATDSSDSKPKESKEPGKDSGAKDPGEGPKKDGETPKEKSASSIGTTEAQ